LGLSRLFYTRLSQSHQQYEANDFAATKEKEEKKIKAREQQIKIGKNKVLLV
jgi:hypothetical protein